MALGVHPQNEAHMLPLAGAQRGQSTIFTQFRNNAGHPAAGHSDCLSHTGVVIEMHTILGITLIVRIMHILCIVGLFSSQARVSTRSP